MDLLPVIKAMYHNYTQTLLWGHPFMTSTRRGEEVGQAKVDACGRGGRGQAPCGRPHRKLKLESTDVILSSSPAKKLASFFTRISSLDGIKVEIFRRYKLVIKLL